jgi:hypothetical protein
VQHPNNCKNFKPPKGTTPKKMETIQNEVKLTTSVRLNDKTLSYYKNVALHVNANTFKFPAYYITTGIITTIKAVNRGNFPEYNNARIQTQNCIVAPLMVKEKYTFPDEGQPMVGEKSTTVREFEYMIFPITAGKPHWAEVCHFGKKYFFVNGRKATRKEFNNFKKSYTPCCVKSFTYYA